MVKILFLDANETLIEAVSYAKSQGYYTITCDNNPSHPTHKIADKSYNISTYDLENLALIVEKEQIDGIVYFTSAHGLYAASRLIERYHLPGIPYSVGKVFSDKGLFRNFLKVNNINCPFYQIIKAGAGDEKNTYKSFPYPVMVKPVDSPGGNLGITKVSDWENLSDAIDFAVQHSPSETVIIEEFIQSSIQVNGDCLIVDGKVEIAYLGQYLYPDDKSIIPFATVFSTNIFSKALYQSLKTEIQKVVTASGLKSGVLNVELRIAENGTIYFIEVNSRHSGNLIYHLMDKAYGVSMSEIAVDIALGKEIALPCKGPGGYYAYCILYAMQDGVLESLELSETLLSHVVNSFVFCHPGDEVHRFTLLRHRLALVHLSFDSQKEMIDIVTHLTDYYKVILK
ncbi:ATP-grasp domain-containing protein [Bacteroides sp.]